MCSVEGCEDVVMIRDVVVTWDCAGDVIVELGEEGDFEELVEG